MTSEGTACCSYAIPRASRVPSKQHELWEVSASRNRVNNVFDHDGHAHPHHRIPALSGCAEHHAGSALHYEHMGKYTKAIDSCSCALHEAPVVAELYEMRARLYIARALVGDKAFALRDADQAIALKPNFPEAHLRRLQALEGLGQLQVPLPPGKWALE